MFINQDFIPTIMVTAIKGQIIRGEYGRLVIRQKADADIEIGELLVSENKNSKILLQVFDLSYGSQISDQNLELASGLRLEEGTDFDFMEQNIRNYNLAFAKTLIEIENNKAVSMCKKMPLFFANARELTKEDVSFLTKPVNPLFFGYLRSGSKKIDFPIYLNGYKVLAHHILIAATTGRGKSNLMNCMLWDAADKPYCGILVLDPHDEYYGRSSRIGLKDHPVKNKIVYYTAKDVPPGCRTLTINLRMIKPSHFNGVYDWSEPQKEALSAYYRKFNDKWVEAIIAEQELGYNFNPATLAVVKRRLMSLLDLNYVDGKIFCNGIFDSVSGASTISDMSNELEQFLQRGDQDQG